MPARVVTPVAWIDETIGMTLAAKDAERSFAARLPMAPATSLSCGFLGRDAIDVAAKPLVGRTDPHL